MSAPDPLVRAGELALEQARNTFALDVWDPPRSDARPIADRWRALIDDMIRGTQGLGWTWQPPYRGDGEFEWCGAFASRCWAAAGLKATERKTYWASCYRLHNWASYERVNDAIKNPRPAADGRVILRLDEHDTTIGTVAGAVFTPRAGDVLIVGGMRSGPGKHVTLVERYDPVQRVFHTYEGNAVGTGPDGKRRQGVVRAIRQLGLRGGDPPTKYHARWLIRPALEDLDIGGTP